MDMQYVVSKQRVIIAFVAKYATEGEHRSKALREVYSNIMKSLKDDATPVKVMQKLLIDIVLDRDTVLHKKYVTCF